MANIQRLVDELENPEVDQIGSLQGRVSKEHYLLPPDKKLIANLERQVSGLG